MKKSYENMSPEDQLAYKRHVENKRLEMSVTETANYKGDRKRRIIVAQKGLELNLPLETIALMSELTTLEIQAIARGEDIDKEDED